MLFDKFRNKATPKQVSECSICNTPLIAKCGNRKIWHWAHKNLLECDHWWESVSEWHLGWQNLVEAKYREVVMGEHRADIGLPGRIIELQKSSISEEEVLEREIFYKDMYWVFDGSGFKERFTLIPKISQAGNEYVKFYWKRPRAYVGVATKPIYIDFGDKILRIKEHTFEEECRNFNGEEYFSRGFKGWGHLLSREDAYDDIFGPYYKEMIHVTVEE